MMATLPVVAAADIPNPLHNVVLSPPVRLGASGSDVVDLNTSRLC
jgi:hypothetical protein